MIYVTSDWHGFSLYKIKKLFEKANFNKEDICYVLGDVVDRGENSAELLEFIMGQKNMILLMGNHEQMMLDCKEFLLNPLEDIFYEIGDEKKKAFYHWLCSGARKTISSFSKLSKEEILKVLSFVEKAPIYKEIIVNNKKYILTHSGINNFNKEKQLSDYEEDDFLWARPKKDEKYFDDVLLIFGHTPTDCYGIEYKNRILFTESFIDVDTGAGNCGKPSLLRLDDMQEFYL